MRSLSIAISSSQSSNFSVVAWYSCQPSQTCLNCGSVYCTPELPPCGVLGFVYSDGCSTPSHQKRVSFVSPLCSHSMHSHCPVGTASGLPFGSWSEFVQSPVPFADPVLSVPTPHRLLPSW